MGTNKQIETVGTLIVVLHLGVVLQHGSDHAHLAINMAAWQNAFIGAVIVVGPLVAAAMLWTRHRQEGLRLLSCTMAGSFLFGLWYHFLASGHDNVFGMASTSVSAAFRITAMLLALIEAIGFLWSLWVLKPKAFVV